MIRRKKNVKKGIQFCLMVCGASGTGTFRTYRGSFDGFPGAIDLLTVTGLLGRTTFVNTLCGKTVLSHKESDDPNAAHVEDGVKIKPLTVGTLYPETRSIFFGNWHVSDILDRARVG